MMLKDHPRDHHRAEQEDCLSSQKSDDEYKGTELSVVDHALMAHANTARFRSTHTDKI